MRDLYRLLVNTVVSFYLLLKIRSCFGHVGRYIKIVNSNNTQGKMLNYLPILDKHKKLLYQRVNKVNHY